MPRFRSTFIAAALLIVALATIQGGAATSLPTSLPLATAMEDEALVEIHLANREAIDGLLEMGVDLAEYRRDNDDGTVTVNAFVTPTERTFLTSLGYRFGDTIEDRSTWETRLEERKRAMRAERNSHEIARKGLAADVRGVTLNPTGPTESTTAGARTASAGAEGANPGPGEEAPPGEVTLMRADYFVHRSGRFLSVEAKSTFGSSATMSMSWREETGTYGAATTMPVFNDAGQYQYHRILVRVGAAGSTTPVPYMVRVASSRGGFAEDHAKRWPGDDLPPMADTYLKGFHTHYMDPVEVYARINSLANEFDSLADIINLPYKTNGYQRKAMGVIGAAQPGGAPAQASSAVVLFSKAYGHEGGNDIRVQVVPGVPPPTTPVVAVEGKVITVTIAPNVSTAAQVVSAITAHPQASSLVTAHTYAGNAGGGAVAPTTVILDDFLAAPDSIPRGPFQPQVIRIGKDRGGSKVGVFIYCQQHAREWATPLTCVETAERLLRNYATHEPTQRLLDNLDIFILPSVNPDGSLYSFYDFASQRRNMTPHCPITASGAMPTSRNAWGVDLNRNNSIGTFFDGYSGASSSCTSDTYAGPAEVSEPEIKNEHWVVDTFTNIKFSNNIHSYGGYFMWAPGAYKVPGRISLTHPNIGIEGYFFEGAEQILSRIKQERGTVILPSRTGPVSDVLYSAAGNSADDQWYRKDIIAYSFETGADLFVSDQTGTQQTTVGFMPDYTTEGSHEANEFAAGNYGLLETAYQYAFDNEDPVAEMKPNGAFGRTSVDATFSWVNEPAVIHYTTDGSTPTRNSPMWQSRGPRQPGQWLKFTETTTVKWIAVDIRGNDSDVRSATFVVDSIAPVTSARLSPDGVNGTYLSPTVTLSAVDAGGAGLDYTEYRLDGGAWTRYTDPLTVNAPGNHTLEYRSADLAGNVETTRSLTFKVAACTVTGTEGIDDLVGTKRADVICGLGGDDVIHGFAGDDLVFGGAGADNVLGGDGQDTLVGHAGDDDLRGDKGNDLLRGGAGYDRLTGGHGHDTCSLDEDGGKVAECEA